MILILINALHSGGAEKTCIELARNLRDAGDVRVVALFGGGPAEQELRAIGVEVNVLEASGPVRLVFACLSLARLIRQLKPDAVLTFLYIADLVGGALARCFAPKAKIYWNVRNNVLARSQTGFASFVAARLCAFSSRILPHVIVYCSPVARSQHEALGFRPAVSVTVENSAAAVPFRFDVEARHSFRAGRFDDEFVFLFVGRFDPVKRVDLYIDACRCVYKGFGGQLRFLIAGRDMTSDNPELRKRIDHTGIADRFGLLGFVQDQQQLYSGADCLVVTSESEGSPNTIYEAIATHLPVIILGTLGTEHIRDELLQRLDSRNLDSLVRAMGGLATGGLPQGLTRRLAGGRRTVEHPIVSHYKRVLSCK